MKFKIAAGTTALALAILDDYEGDRLLSSPVTKITQDGGPYPITISTKSGLKFKAKKAISTIPMNILSSIEFQPPLSHLQRGAITTGITPARADKLLCKTSLDLSTGFSISCEGGDMPFSSGFVDGKDEDQTLVLLAHPDVSLGGTSDIIEMVETLRPGGLPVTSAYASLWSEDPFAGGVMPVRGPGYVEKYHEELQNLGHGDLYFCGSDFADGWRGFMDGAFESAYTVTRRVLRSLR